VETAKNHFFSGKYPADEVITIWKELSPFIMGKPGKNGVV
jgi:hypothetical protein